MAKLQGMSSQAKQQIMDFLKNRGGVLRCGHFNVWQTLYWRCFQKETASSTHEEVSATQKLVFELEQEDKVILRQDDSGIYNYIAIKTASVDELTNNNGGSNLSSNELEEILGNMFLQYSYLEKKLMDSQTDYEIAMQILATFENENVGLKKENEATRAELVELKKHTNCVEVKKNLDEQKKEIENVRQEKALAEEESKNLLTEISQLSSKLKKMELDSNASKKIKEALQKKVDDLGRQLKIARRESIEKIASLESELSKIKKGDGLTASKAVALSIMAFDRALDNIRGETVEDIVCSCAKYLPIEKVDRFLESVYDAHQKIKRRK